MPKAMSSIALLDGPDDSPDTLAHQVEMTWERLGRVLHDVQYTACNPCKGKDCPHKRGRAWLPVSLVEPVCKRLDANVTAINFAVFDLDDLPREGLAALAQKLDGYEYIVHQTHRGNGYRLVMPLDTPVPAHLWRGVWEGIAQAFGLPKDVTCKNESRLYYMPTRPEGAGYEIYEGHGKPLAWSEIDPIFPGGVPEALERLGAGVKADLGAKVDPANPENLRQGPLDLAEMRRKVASMRRPESRELLDRILSGRALAEVGQRDTELNKAASLLATAPLDKPYPADAIVELMHGSIHAMVTEPEGLEHWLHEARKKYLRAVARRLENDHRSDENNAALMRVLGMDSDTQLVSGPDAEDENWRRELLYTLDEDGSPKGLRSVGANANTILKHDPEWKGTLRFNEITREIDVTGGPLLGKPKATLHIEATNWLARSQYKLFLSSKEVGEQMLAVARQRAYDPLRDWLTGLKWDGTDRVTDFFSTYYGAEGDVDHLKRISVCFLVSCAARTMEPGCEVHTVPILIGAQGAGKSRSLKALGAPYFTDTGLIIGDKDSRMLIASKWIVELAELASVRNADIEKVKNFVSQAADDFRPPYGHVMESFLRRCVFVGTTNHEDVLTDWTGNRRWWPIKVTKADVEGIARDRDQLFAQALEMYRAGEKWYLTPSEAARAEEIAAGFARPSTRAEQVLAWFASKPRDQRPTDMTTYDMLNQIFQIPSAQISHAQTMDAGRVLRELKFTKHRKSLGGNYVWTYRTPEALLNMRRDEKPGTLEVVEPIEESGS